MAIESFLGCEFNLCDMCFGNREVGVTQGKKKVASFLNVPMRTKLPIMHKDPGGARDKDEISVRKGKR